MDMPHPPIRPHSAKQAWLAGGCALVMVSGVLRPRRHRKVRLWFRASESALDRRRSARVGLYAEGGGPTAAAAQDQVHHTLSGLNDTSSKPSRPTVWRRVGKRSDADGHTAPRRCAGTAAGGETACEDRPVAALPPLRFAECSLFPQSCPWAGYRRGVGCSMREG